MKSWNVLRVLQLFCPASHQTYGRRCECTEYTVHFSLVSGHLLVFHQSCWVCRSLLKVVEADITMQNGLIHNNLPMYVYPCCLSFPGWVSQSAASEIDCCCIGGRQTPTAGGWSASFWPQLNNSPPSSHQELILSCNPSLTFTFNAYGKITFAVTHPFVVKAGLISPISDW